MRALRFGPYSIILSKKIVSPASLHFVNFFAEILEKGIRVKAGGNVELRTERTRVKSKP